MVTGYLDNFYARLGVSHTATQDEIRNAFHAAALKFHPDVNKDTRATEIFLQIQEAYETLSNPAKRIAYDEILPADIKTPDNILVNAIYSRESLTVLEHPQLLYVLLNIMAAPKATEKLSHRQPLNLCLVIDNSNSMSGQRLNTVKDTALNIIQSLKTEDILSVVTFNDRAEVIVPATRNQNLNILEARIGLINARGGTEIYQGLEMGYNEVIQNLRPDYSNQIILITDGRTYGDEDDALKLAEIASDQDITIHALGIGHFRCTEQTMVPHQYAQRQVLADQGGQILLDLVGVHFVDHVGHQHDQGPLMAVRGQMQKGLIVPRFDQIREPVEGSVQ